MPTTTESTDVVSTYLLQFNPQTVGGIILPRGCSAVSLDLRKTILRQALERFHLLQTKPITTGARCCGNRRGLLLRDDLMDEAGKSSSLSNELL